MPSQNITALTNAAAFAPDALFYMAISPFGVTDDRKITGSVLFTTIEPLDNNTAALVVTNSAVPTVPQVVFTNTGGTRRMQIAMAGGATITDTFDDVSIFSSVAASTLSMGIWNAIDTGEAAEFFLYTGAAGLNHTRLRAVDSGAGGANWLNIASSGVLMTSNATPGGLILLTDLAAPIVFVTGGTALGNEKGRFDAAGFTLGKVSSITGALNLANSASAFLTTITAGNAAAARTYVWPTNFGASGSVLTDAAGNGTLSWAAAGGTPASPDTSVQFNNAGAFGGSAALEWINASNRLVIGTASSATGQLRFAVSGSANTQTFQAGDTPAASNAFKWPGPDPVGGQVLTAAAPAAGIVVLSWTSPAAGSFAIGGTVTSGTTGSVLFVGTGPVLAQDNANFFWDDTNNRLGLGTATPAKLLHVNGIAQLGTVSATTGQLQLANSASANLTTIQAGNAAAARTYTWPLDFGASGSVLTDAAGNGTLSWAAVATGSAAWSAITDPAGNLALTMAANTSTFTYNTTTGANDLFKLTTGSNDTGTGYVVSILTPGGSNAKSAFGVTARGSLALEVRANGSVQAPGTGGTQSTRIGIDSLAGTRCIAFGPTATATGTAAMALGSTATAGSTTGGIAIGDSASATADNGVAVGQAATAATDAIAIGKSASANATRGISIGRGSSVQSNADSLTIGENALANAANQVVFGSDTTVYNNWFLGRGINSATPSTLTINATAGGGTDIAGSIFNIAGGKSTGSAAPGRVHLQTSSLLTTGSTVQTLIDRAIFGATKALANNTTTTVVNVTDASNTVAGGIVDYAVEVFDGTDLQIETGSFTYQITNKGGTIANNTITFAGASGVGVTSNYPKNTTTSGTLVVTWTITAANPALLQINANSSLTPSTGFPRVTYTLRNLTSQAVAVQ